MSAIFGGSTKISSGINAVVDILSGDVITVASGLNVVVESGLNVVVQSGLSVTINSGDSITASMSGNVVRIAATTIAGTAQLLRTTDSGTGSLAIGTSGFHSVTLTSGAFVITESGIGVVAVIPGGVQVSGTVGISGEVFVSGTVFARVAGVRIDGGFVNIAINKSGTTALQVASSGVDHIVTNASGEQSGMGVIINSGVGVTVNSGVGVTVQSGFGVLINSGAIVLIGSGTFMGAVSVSGIVTSRMQAINYLGNFVNLQTNRSGDTGIQVASSGFSTITITSGVNIINDSGFGVIVNSGVGVTVNSGLTIISGQFVSTTASGNIVRIAATTVGGASQLLRTTQSGFGTLAVGSSGYDTITLTSGANILNRDAVPTTGRGRAALVLNNNSGGTILSSGDVIVATIKAPRTNSGDVYVGFDVAGGRPYSGYGMTLLEPGNVITFGIDNLNRIRAFSTISGFTQIVYGGTQY